MKGCNHKCAHAPDNRHASTGISFITVKHNNSFTRTRIIDMITLTSDKFILVKVGFSTRDPVDQGPGRSTPRQIAHLRGFATPGKAV
jgi:hypothetical protein